MPFAQEQMGFNRPPKLFLRQDVENGADPLGKTGFYDPQAESITIYVSNRHPKDILRSLAHELMHHTQKCNGDFENAEGMGEQGYAQNNPHMRNMEIQAYQASIVFRDWEDSLKETIYYEHLQKGANKAMSIKEWRNGELTTLLSEAFGFKFNLDHLAEERTGSGIDHGGGDDEEAEEETEGTADSKREEKGLRDEGQVSSGRNGPNDRRPDPRKRPMEEDGGTGYKGGKDNDDDDGDGIPNYADMNEEEEEPWGMDTVKDPKPRKRRDTLALSGDKKCEDGSAPNPRTGNCPEESRSVRGRASPHGLEEKAEITEAQIRAVAKRVVARLKKAGK